MSSRGGNGTKYVKTIMYQLYGKKCMLCGWRPKGHTKKKAKRFLTYHHIHEYSKGGETSIENGAILCNRCHEWLNKENEADQITLNEKLQHIKSIRYRR